MDIKTDDFLAHYGVLGMQWGKRKAKTATVKKLSRKEIRADRDAFYQNKASSLVAKALKDPTTLISLNTGGLVPTIVTGKAFVEHLSQGGAMSLKYTDVYATKQGDGPYILNDNPNVQYQKPK